MEIVVAMLCDYATVREGLLHILGGGITRMWRPELPAALGVALAVQLEMTTEEDRLPHEVRAELWDMNRRLLAQAAGAVQYTGGGRFERGERPLLPLVLPFHQVGIARHGRHELRIAVDGGPSRTLAFWVLHPEEQNLPAL